MVGVEAAEAAADDDEARFPTEVLIAPKEEQQASPTNRKATFALFRRHGERDNSRLSRNPTSIFPIRHLKETK
jgi:hypothetical protein